MYPFIGKHIGMDSKGVLNKETGVATNRELLLKPVDYKLLLFGLRGWILFRLRITINFSIIVVECCIFRGSSVLAASDYERSQ